MKEATLRRLQKTGAIQTYEVLEKDTNGTVLDVNIKFYRDLSGVLAERGLAASLWKKVQGYAWAIRGNF